MDLLTVMLFFSERRLSDIEQLPYSSDSPLCQIKLKSLQTVFELTFVYDALKNVHHRDSPPLAKASRWNLSL